MIEYFDELDNKNIYLPLVNTLDTGKKNLYDYNIPMSFIEKYNNIFKTSESLINIYKNFDIGKWFDENILIDYEESCSIYSEYESIAEEMYCILEDYKKIDVKSKNIEIYFNLIERLSFLFIHLFPENKKYYEKLNVLLKQMQEELKIYSTIIYTPNKVDNIYLPDAWFITPNGYLYNVGSNHKGCNLTFSYNKLKYEIENDKQIFSPFIGNKVKASVGFTSLANDIIKRGYVTNIEFKTFLNYISQPSYLDSVDGIPITREKHIVNIVTGIVMAHAYFNRFFEEFIEYVKNPKIEINKIEELTKCDISDVLVRCCGFHKIESMQNKTITTSCINYEEEFRDYIEKGWTIQFIKPIIINREKEIIEEYPSDFLTIKKLLKKI